MTTIDWLLLVDLVAVAAVCISTIWILQRLLNKAHHLLRLGLVLVCAGTVIDLYAATQVTHVPNILESVASAVCNVGQATVYLWAANSKTVWLMIRQAELTTYRHLIDGKRSNV